MQTQPNYCAKLLLLLACTAAVFTACKREALLGSSEDRSATANHRNAVTTITANSNTAAAHIAASEKLLIPNTIEVPANLPGGNTRVATYYAVGVQKYQARVKAGSDRVAYEWAFVAPQADLFDAANTKLGTHGAGPYWQITNEDLLYGQQYSPARTAPSSDPGSIDWLLLMPKTGTTPTGLFADVLYIQRIATKGGKAPSTPPTTATETVDVKYKAVYRFTKKAL
jgi:hypothetical protein